jgi:hypothetical protein
MKKSEGNVKKEVRKGKKLKKWLMKIQIINNICKDNFLKGVS